MKTFSNPFCIPVAACSRSWQSLPRRPGKTRRAFENALPALSMRSVKSQGASVKRAAPSMNVRSGRKAPRTKQAVNDEGTFARRQSNKGRRPSTKAR